MAPKKSRTPPPPRPVQAPKARPSERGPRGLSGRPATRLWLIGASAAVVAVVVAVVLATTLGGGSDASALAAAGCVQETFPDQGRKHVTALEKGFKYNSFPPTSGPHSPQPAIWNVYEEPVRQLLLVHNLEHGGIVVQYGERVPEETVAAIREWYAKDPTAIVVAPLPALGDKVALTAWTHLATCPGFDEDAFDAFVDRYRFKGPERLPMGALEPGT